MSFHAVATVGFEEQVYTVNEDDHEIEVCIQILSPEVIDFSVIATLATEDDNAKGIVMQCLLIGKLLRSDLFFKMVRTMVTSNSS